MLIITYFQYFEHAFLDYTQCFVGFFWFHHIMFSDFILSNSTTAPQRICCLSNSYMFKNISVFGVKPNIEVLLNNLEMLLFCKEKLMTVSQTKGGGFLFGPKAVELISSCPISSSGKATLNGGDFSVCYCVGWWLLLFSNKIPFAVLVASSFTSCYFQVFCNQPS